MPLRVPWLTIRDLNRALARQFLRPKEAVLKLRPFKPLARADRAALVEEAEKLVRFSAPQSKTHRVRG